MSAVVDTPGAAAAGIVCRAVHSELNARLSEQMNYIIRSIEATTIETLKRIIGA